MRDFKERKLPSRSSDAFFQPKVQKKLSVGQAGDKYEKEADSVADKVVSKSGGSDIQKAAQPEEEKVQQKPLAESISSVQKKEMAEEEPVQKKGEEEEPVQKKGEEEEPVQKKGEEEEPVQKKGEEEEPVQKKGEEEEPVQKKGEEEEPVQKKGEEEEPVQKKEEEEKNPVQQKAAAATNTLEQRLAASKGKGISLTGELKQEMEKSFGADLSHVRIHFDAEANQMSQEMGAQAFTHGNDIYFNKGKFNPQSKEGKRLLAHELTHTVQQKGMGQKLQKQEQPAQKKKDGRK